MKTSAGESLGTVQRVVEILRYFALHGDAALKELSTAIALSPSTCHRLLDLLAREGFIEQDTARRRYRLGRDLYRISALIQSKQDICRIALPFLREVVTACDETCVFSLYLPADHKIYFAEKVDSSMMLRYQLKMNTPLSVLWGASGRVILAHLKKEDVDRIYAMEGNAPASGEKLPTRRELDGELAQIRSRGYDISYGQKVVDAVGIGAPVFGADRKVVGSICVTVPEARLAARDRPRLAEIVRMAAGKLSNVLGAPWDGALKASA